MIINIPAKLFASVAVAVSTEETRFYLRGVYVEANSREQVRLTATDGHMLLAGRGASTIAEAFEPFIVAVERQTDALLKSARKKGVTRLELDLRDKMWRALTANGHEEAVGRFALVDGTFPDYRRIIPTKAAPTLSEGPDTAAIGVPLYGRLVDAAKHAGVACFSLSGTDSKAPQLVRFAGSDDVPEGNLVGVVMPMRSDISGGTGKSPAWMREPLPETI